MLFCATGLWQLMEIKEKKRNSFPFITNPPFTPLLLNHIFHVKHFFFTSVFCMLLDELAATQDCQEYR